MDLNELLELVKKSKSILISYEDDKRVLVEFNKADELSNQDKLERLGYSFEMGM